MELEDELLAEARRLTFEIDDCRDRVTAAGSQRRQVFAALRQQGVTYKRISQITGLHEMTIQQDMGRYRKETPREIWESFTKSAAKSGSNEDPCLTDSTHSKPVAGARSA